MQRCTRTVRTAARSWSCARAAVNPATVVPASRSPRRLEARGFGSSPRVPSQPLPWFVDADTPIPDSSAAPADASSLDDPSPRLATAPAPTPPPSHLASALHPLHDYLSTSPFLDKDSLRYIHAREADPEASWCDWIVCATLRHGRERGLRGAIEGVKRHLAAHPVELVLDPASTQSTAPPPFAPPSTRPEIHGLPPAPTKHARSRSLRTSRSSNFPSASDAGTGWALLDAGTLVVHVFTPQARETYGRTIEQMWERIGEAEHAASGGAAGAGGGGGGWKSSAQREEDRRRELELERNMGEVRKEMEAEAELATGAGAERVG